MQMHNKPLHVIVRRLAPHERQRYVLLEGNTIWNMLGP